jgi:hypothetical protein
VRHLTSLPFDDLKTVWTFLGGSTGGSSSQRNEHIGRRTSWPDVIISFKQITQFKSDDDPNGGIVLILDNSFKQITQFKSSSKKEGKNQKNIIKSDSDPTGGNIHRMKISN